jgi:hypothetical protein
MLHCVIWWKFSDISEVLAVFETSLNIFQSTQCSIPEDSHLKTGGDETEPALAKLT